MASSKDVHTFQFFDLPVELRNMIYRNLCASKNLPLDSEDGWGVGRIHWPSSQFLRVSKQFKLECEDENLSSAELNLVASRSSYPKRFPTALSPSLYSRIKELRLDLPISFEHETGAKIFVDLDSSVSTPKAVILPWLKSFPGLRCLFLVFYALMRDVEAVMDKGTINESAISSFLQISKDMWPGLKVISTMLLCQQAWNWNGNILNEAERRAAVEMDDDNLGFYYVERTPFSFPWRGLELNFYQASHFDPEACNSLVEKFAEDIDEVDS